MGATQIAPFFYLGGQMAKAGKSRSKSRKSQAANGVTADPKRRDGVEEQESVAKSLIEKLGLYEEYPAIQDEASDRRGDVESE
jgi:hypothetical protein